MNLAAQTIRRSLDRETQERLIAQVREVLECAPLRTLATPGCKPMAVRVDWSNRRNQLRRFKD